MSRRYGVALLLLSLSLLLAPPLMAQEATPDPLLPTDLPTEVPSLTPTPSETPTETPTLTETPTETATETATETPTETATLDATLTATATLEALDTAEPTASPSETATPEWTATETATPSPTAYSPADLPEETFILLFSADFNDFYYPHYELYGPQWFIVEHQGVVASQISLENIPTQVTSTTPLNVAVQARFLITSGSVQLRIRNTVLGAYRAVLDANGQVRLYRGDQLIEASTLPSGQGNAWHYLRITGFESSVSVMVDGLELIHFEDPSPLTNGPVTLFASDLAGSAVLMDDLALWVANSQQNTTSYLASDSQLVTANNLSTNDILTFVINNNPTLNYRFGSVYSNIPGFPLPPVTDGFPPLPANVKPEGKLQWSPSQRNVAFNCSINNISNKLCLLNVSNSIVTDITPDVFSTSEFTWSPDGSLMALIYIQGTSRQLRTYNPTTRSYESIVLSVSNTSPVSELGWIYWHTDNYIYYDNASGIARVSPSQPNVVQQVVVDANAYEPIAFGSSLVYRTLNPTTGGYNRIMLTSTNPGPVQILLNDPAYAPQGVGEYDWLPDGRLAFSTGVLSAQVFTIPIDQGQNPPGTQIYSAAGLYITAMDGARVVAQVTPPTSTLPPFATNTPNPTVPPVTATAQAVATLQAVFPAPLLITPVRLSSLNADVHVPTDQPPLCSRDIDQSPDPSDAGDSVISPGTGRVFVIDQAIDDNLGLGNFMSLYLPFASLPSQLQSLLTQTYPRIAEGRSAANAAGRTDYLMLGFGHLSSVSAFEDQEVVKASPIIGITGKSGLPATSLEHLDVTTFYVSNSGNSIIRPGTHGQPNRIQNYFGVFLQRDDNAYGIRQAIDPIVLWPFVTYPPVNGTPETCRYQ